MGVELFESLRDIKANFKEMTLTIKKSGRETHLAGGPHLV